MSKWLDRLKVLQVLEGASEGVSTTEPPVVPDGFEGFDGAEGRDVCENAKFNQKALKASLVGVCEEKKKESTFSKNALPNHCQNPQNPSTDQTPSNDTGKKEFLSAPAPDFPVMTDEECQAAIEKYGTRITLWENFWSFMAELADQGASGDFVYESCCVLERACERQIEINGGRIREVI